MTVMLLTKCAGDVQEINEAHTFCLWPCCTNVQKLSVPHVHVHMDQTGLATRLLLNY